MEPEKEFLATLKLVSGEEIIATVIYLEDEDKVLLENPFSVELSKQRQGKLEITGFSIFSKCPVPSHVELFLPNNSYIF